MVMRDVRLGGGLRDINFTRPTIYFLHKKTLSIFDAVWFLNIKDSIVNLRIDLISTIHLSNLDGM